MSCILKYGAGAISASCALLAVIDLFSEGKDKSQSIKFMLLSSLSFVVYCIIPCNTTSMLLDEKLAAPIRPSVNLYDIRCT